MYNNTGNKIRSIASTLFLVSLGAWFVLDIVISISIGQISEGAGFGFFVVFFVIGALITYILNIVLAGFGELIDACSQNAKTSQEILNYLSAMSRKMVTVDGTPAESKKTEGDIRTSLGSLMKAGAKEKSKEEKVRSPKDEKLDERLVVALEYVIDNIGEFKSAKGIKDYLIKEVGFESLIDPELLHILDNRINMERLYGGMAGSTKKDIEKYLYEDGEADFKMGTGIIQAMQFVINHPTQFKDTAEIREYLITVAGSESLLDPELLSTIDKRIQSEKLYGSMCLDCAKDFENYLKQRAY